MGKHYYSVKKNPCVHATGLNAGISNSIERRMEKEYYEKVGNPTTNIEVNHMEAARNYDALLDAKNRITLRGVRYQNYNVRIFENGCVIMEPRVLSVPDMAVMS